MRCQSLETSFLGDQASVWGEPSLDKDAIKPGQDKDSFPARPECSVVAMQPDVETVVPVCSIGASGR